MVFYVKNEESSSSDVHVCVALYAEAVAQIVIAIYDTVVVDQAVTQQNDVAEKLLFHPNTPIGRMPPGK